MSEQHFLVVGGTRGIGKALVKHLIGEGNFVSVLGRTPSLDLQSPKLAHYVTDVSNREVLLSSLDHAAEHYGKFTSVVFMQRHRAQKDEFDLELNVALSATKNAIDHLISQKYFCANSQLNSIVLVSSIADRYVASEQSLGYHIGKAGISQMARYYALELGAMGIRVNSVSPCVVAKEEAKEFYDKNEWLVDRFKKYIPLGRMGKPQDIVNAIMFLAGDQALYITGQNIVVDGGLTLRSHGSMIRDFSQGT